MLEIQPLGGLVMRCDGEPVTALLPHKANSPLSTSPTPGGRTPRKVLAELFWEERSQERSMGSLRIAVNSRPTSGSPEWAA